MSKRSHRSKPAETEDDDGTDSFETYLEYNRALRTWFVAFGVGGPALFLVNDTLAQRLVADGQLRLVVLLFLIGAGAQVGGALLNKFANWYVYSSALDAESPNRWVHRTRSGWLLASSGSMRRSTS